MCWYYAIELYHLNNKNTSDSAFAEFWNSDYIKQLAKIADNTWFK